MLLYYPYKQQKEYMKRVFIDMGNVLRNAFSQIINRDL